VSLVGWVLSSASTGTRTILQYSSAAQLNAFVLQVSSGRITATVNGAVSLSGTGVTALSGAWVLEVIQWRGDTGQMVVYENGVLVSTWTAATGALPSSGCLVVGHLSTGSCTPGSGYSGSFTSTDYWIGMLGEVRYCTV
jgi:hypothetical protein